MQQTFTSTCTQIDIYLVVYYDYLTLLKPTQFNREGKRERSA